MMTLEPLAASFESRRQAFVDGLLFRVVACLFLASVVVMTALPSDLPFGDFVPQILACLAVAAVNGVYWYAGKRRAFPMGDFYLHWFVDLCVISGFLYSLGGIDVPYGPFVYSMIIVTSAVFMSRAASYLVATGGAVCLVGLTVAPYLGLVPAPPRVWSHHYSPAGQVTVVSGGIVFLFLNAYLAGTLSDGLKAANARIEDHRRSLERRVQERTALLESRTRELQERTDELEEIVHIMTHDLQNVAVASIETVRKVIEIEGAELSPRARRYADRLLRDCRLMATMLRNLLEVVSQTTVAQRRELVDVGAVVRDAVARAETMAEKKGIAIAVGELPPLLAEVQKIYQVFENLLSNACKYVGDKPTPRIEVGGAMRNGGVEYFVRDNGIGIEAAQLGRIFQLYHRAPEQSVAGVVQQGHGIGLAVVKRIVQRYGGRIWVESVPGEGSTFHLTFPREERVDA